MATLQTIWRGEESLARTYWIYGVVVNGLIIGVVGTFLVTLSQPVVLMLAYLYLTVATGIFVIVAIWRSAGRYAGSKVWSILARIGCVIAALAMVKRVLELAGA